MKVRPTVDYNQFVSVHIPQGEVHHSPIWAALRGVYLSKATEAFLAEFLFLVGGETLIAIELAVIWDELHNGSVMMTKQHLSPSQDTIDALFDTVVDALVEDPVARDQAKEYKSLSVELAARQVARIKARKPVKKKAS